MYLNLWAGLIFGLTCRLRAQFTKETRDTVTLIFWTGIETEGWVGEGIYILLTISLFDQFNLAPKSNY
jgi:hypothetical protein